MNYRDLPRGRKSGGWKFTAKTLLALLAVIAMGGSPVRSLWSRCGRHTWSGGMSSRTPDRR